MATTLGNAARNAACDATTALVNAGSGPGKLRIKSGAAVVIAEVVLGDPAFGAAVAGVATASGLPLTGAGVVGAGAGTNAATFDVCDSDDNVIWSGLVGGSGDTLGEDVGEVQLQLDNINIADGQEVNIEAFTHTQPASV